MQKVKVELYHDNFQNYKRYGIPSKAQLVIADIPYNIGEDAYGSNPIRSIRGKSMREGKSNTRDCAMKGRLLMSSIAKCKECGKEIRWIKTTAGKAMPVDPKLVPYWVTAGGTGRIVTTEGKTLSCAWKGDMRDITGMGYVPHWATCAARQEERKARASAKESTMQGCLF